MLTLLAILTPLFMAATAVLIYKVYQLQQAQHTTEILKAPPQVDLCKNLPYNYDEVELEGILNYDTARSLTQYYEDTNNYVQPFQDDNGNTALGADSRSVWFPLERLKNFIWHIERHNCINKCQHSLGLRVYFARYPEPASELWNDGSLKGVPQRYANRQTVFMVPTFYDENSQLDRDFYPDDNSCNTSFSKWAKLPGEDFGKHKPDRIRFLLTVSDPGDGQNHGGLIPPDNSGGTAF